MKKQHISLTEVERQELEALLAKGVVSARVLRRATGILALNRGATLEAVAEFVGVQNDTVRAWRKRYEAEGLAGLYDKPRSGRPIEIDGTQRAQITALACSEAPTGHSDWSLRLLAEKVVELGYCDEISHTQVGNILKKNELQPHLKKMWCLGQLSSAFMARMEKLLCWLNMIAFSAVARACLHRRIPTQA